MDRKDKICHTSLHDEHIKHQAKMIEFAGFDMPLHYGSQIQEHLSVRQSAGLFDVSHMLPVIISGSEAEPFLRFLLANDVKKIASGHALYTCMLNHQAGIVDDLIVYRLSSEKYVVVVNAGNRQKDTNWINDHSDHFDVQVDPCQHCGLLAIQGPEADKQLRRVISRDLSDRLVTLKPFQCVEYNNWLIARTGYTGEDGYEVILPNNEAVDLWQALIDKGVEPCGLGARDSLRLEAGLNLYGMDMDEHISPYECGLGFSVDLKDSDRDFIGRDELLKLKHKGVTQQQVGVVLQAKGVLRAKQTVIDQQRYEGVITSGTYSPCLQRSIGFARVHNDAEDLTVNIRGKQLNLSMVGYPFVRKGKILVSVPDKH